MHLRACSAPSTRSRREARRDSAVVGTATTEPAGSNTVKLVVPAKVKLLSVTRRVAWGGTVKIAGELEGGYLPPGGALVRLLIGYGNASATYGVKEHVTSKRFAATYTFGQGDPQHRVAYWFALSTLPMTHIPTCPRARADGTCSSAATHTTCCRSG